MANVILLRSPSSDIEDRYESAFREAGYQPLSAPVLEMALTNVDTLKDIIGAGPTLDNFDGVILTSARSCEAWRTAVQQLVGVSAATREGSWSLVPFFVVGQGTASALAEVRKVYGQTEFTPMIIRGESSGTGEQLARYIQEHWGNVPKKLLYLTGDKNSDTVSSILNGTGIELRSLKVYETRGSRTFERDLQRALQRASPASKRWWFVHFAPSAAEFAIPILNDHFNSEPFKSDMEISHSTQRVAAIGSVTSSFLQDELKIRVDVVAVKPSPRDLVAAIVAYDRDSGL